MSQNEYPHDPFGGRPASDPSAPADQAPEAGGAAPQTGAPQSPYAAPSAAGAGQSPYGAPSASGPGQQSPYGAPHPQGAPGGAPGGQQQYAQGGPAGGPHPSAAPIPPGFQGMYEGPLTGQAVSASDSRMWSVLAPLSAVLGYVVGAGFLGWVGPLIIFLVYKDRDRYVRYNAAESLNAAIATVIAEIVLTVVITILAVVTLGFGSLLFPIVWVPALLHVIFAIIGAVKANQGTWWNYPLNIRLVK